MNQSDITTIGKAMRQLYEKYGAAAVLTNDKYLINGLRDLARIDYTPKLRSQMALAMDAGLGRLYLEQLEKRKPDDGFNQRVYRLLTQDAGLSDVVAKEISGYFNEMMVWNEDPDSETTYQKILYYDKQGGSTDKDHAYKIVTQILDKNGNVINEIFSYVDNDETDNEETEKNVKERKKTVIIVTAAIIVAVLIVAFIILRPIFNNTAVPQQMNNTTVKYLGSAGNHIFNPQLKELNEDLTLTTDIPEKEGYTFVEWNTKPDGSGDSYSPGDTYTLDQPLVLYAQWEEKVSETVTEPATRSSVSYMITYDANGGTGGPEKQRVINGTEFEISQEEPTRKGYEFSGWSTSKGLDDDIGLTYSVGNKYRINNDLTLYAQWKKIDKEADALFKLIDELYEDVTVGWDKLEVDYMHDDLISIGEKLCDAGFEFSIWEDNTIKYLDRPHIEVNSFGTKLSAEYKTGKNWDFETGGSLYFTHYTFDSSVSINSPWEESSRDAFKGLLVGFLPQRVIDILGKSWEDLGFTDSVIAEIKERNCRIEKNADGIWYDFRTPDEAEEITLFLNNNGSPERLGLRFSPYSLSFYSDDRDDGIIYDLRLNTDVDSLDLMTK